MAAPMAAAVDSRPASEPRAASPAPNDGPPAPRGEQGAPSSSPAGDRDPKPENLDDLDGSRAAAEPAAVGGDVVASLALALARAAEAGRWDVVALLAKELEARRLANLPNVVAIGAKRHGSGSSGSGSTT